MNDRSGREENGGGGVSGDPATSPVGSAHTSAREALPYYLARNGERVAYAVNGLTGAVLWCGCGDALNADDVVCGNCNACRDFRPPDAVRLASAERDRDMFRGLAAGRSKALDTVTAERDNLAAQVKRWEDKEVARATGCCGSQEREAALRGRIKEMARALKWEACSLPKDDCCGTYLRNIESDLHAAVASTSRASVEATIADGAGSPGTNPQPIPSRPETDPRTR